MTIESSIIEPDIVEIRIDKFRVYLTGAGKRLTAEREFVARAAIALPVPFGLNDVMDAISDSSPRQISRAAAFRTMSLLVDAGVVEPTGDDRYF